MKTLIVILIFFPLLLSAQGSEFLFEPEGIPLSIYDWEPYCPWAGGMRNSSPEFVDIDGDGDFDIFSGRWGNYLVFFENNGTIMCPNYDYITETYDSLYIGFYWIWHPVFPDIDNDNDKDLVIWTDQFHELLFINEGTALSPDFVFVTNSFLETASYGAGRGDFVDIDSDGDLDIFEGDYYGQINYYENLGTAQNYSYPITPTILSGIDVGYEAIVSMCDIDGDNDYDLFIGNQEGKVYFYRNIGDSVNYDFEYVTDNFAGVDVTSEATPAFCDIEGDGDFDLFVGRESYIWDEGIGDVSFYENTGTPQNYIFEHRTDNYLSLDVRSWCSPHLVDVDADDDLDIVTGGEYICYFENEGSAASPSYRFVTSEFGGYTAFWGARIALGDLDADGDQDMMVGTESMTTFYISWLENIGTPDSAVFRAVVPVLISTADMLYYPSLVDIDADGDLDLLVGTEINFVETLQLYENIGTVTRPQFNLTPQTLSTFDSIEVYQPNFTDYDSDGDCDLFFPNAYTPNGGLSMSYYENVGTPQSPNFELVTHNFAAFSVSNILSNCIDFGDIDGDGDLDLFYGTQLGGIKFYRSSANPFQAELSITVQGNDIILTWGNVANAVEYRIFYQDIPYFTSSGIPQAIVLPPDTVWTDENAVWENKRFYRMIVEY